MIRPPGSDRHQNRRGVALALALACLVLIVLVLGGLLRRVAEARLVVRAEERRLQADWLADSGLARAAARLAADPSYAGETWNLPAATLGGAEPAVVAITIQPEPAAPDRRRVRVQADYPPDPPRRARRTRTTTITIAADRPPAPAEGETPR